MSEQPSHTLSNSGDATVTRDEWGPPVAREQPRTEAGRRFVSAIIANSNWKTRGVLEGSILAIEHEAAARQSSATAGPELREAAQEAYDLICLLAFAKPDAEVGVPKTFTVLDRLRAALAAAPEDGAGGEAATRYETEVERFAAALHEDCRLEWQAIAVTDPGRMVTQHAVDAHYGRAHDLVRRLHPELDAAAQPKEPDGSGER